MSRNELPNRDLVAELTQHARTPASFLTVLSTIIGTSCQIPNISTLFRVTNCPIKLIGSDNLHKCRTMNLRQFYHTQQSETCISTLNGGVKY